MRKLSVFLLSTVFVLSFVACGQAQNATPSIKEAKIKTFFHCANGKALIEKELAKEKGVQSVVADVESKIVTIQYDETLTNQDQLVLAIEKTGYRTEFTPEDKVINKACSHDVPDGGEQH